ncbi:MAG: flagellar hook-associated protein FlgK [candidate division Zixibacteria bacterium]|nr:flagellar hook-associated protein FlgK [candidate division Zixibacteria bacterium]
MPGLFQGLEIGKRALLGHQVSLQTVGHNIANVNTPGYTRQRVRVMSSLPELSIHGAIGAGFEVDSIYHVRDLFLGDQYRQGQKDLGQWTYKSKSLQQIESIFAEPGGNSINEVLDQFWNDWSALSSDAENSGNRSSLIANATQLIHTFKQLATSLEDLQRSTDRDLASLTAESNGMTTEIARLNQQIVNQELDGSKANDLRDMRDRIIDELSSILDVNVNQRSDGSASVYMGSMLLVDGPDSFAIDANANHDGDKVTHALVWRGSEIELKNVNGKIAGLMETRDKIIPNYLDDLNTLSRTIVEEVNRIHMAGYGLDGTTDVAFFNPAFTDAKDLRLNQEILLDKNKIAASDSSNSDDRSNGMVAMQLADMRDALLMSSQTATINQFYHGMVGDLGVETREANNFTSNYELISHQIDNQRQSVQGVSLDEEMVNLVKAQHAFDAAARIITVMDEALDTLITRMGIVG